MALSCSRFPLRRLYYGKLSDNPLTRANVMNNQRRLIRTASVMFLAVSALHGAAQQTLREQARLGPVERHIMTGYEPVTLAQIASQSETIVVGTVEGGRTFVSPDGKQLFTDYDITVDLALKRTVGRELVRGDALVVRRAGGVTQIDGVSVVAIENDFPQFKPGERYVLFVRSVPSESHYVMVHGPEGAFVVSDGRVRQVSEEFGSWNRERGTRTALASFVDEVRAMLRAQ